MSAWGAVSAPGLPWGCFFMLATSRSVDDGRMSRYLSAGKADGDNAQLAGPREEALADGRGRGHG